MLNWNDYLQLSAGLVSVVNPIGVIPTFISLTINRSSRDRKQTAIVCAASVAMVLFISLLAGEPILHFFGIGLPAFRVAGGLLVLLMGISMLYASDDRVRHTPEERAESYEKESVAVVPWLFLCLAAREPSVLLSSMGIWDMLCRITCWLAL